MTANNILSIGIAAVSGLIGAFGGILLKIVPPNYNTKLLIISQVVTSFAALGIYYLCLVFVRYFLKSKTGRTRSIWFMIGLTTLVIAVVSGSLYYSNFNKLTLFGTTFNKRIVRGNDFTQKSIKQCSSQNLKSNEECEAYLLNNFYNEDEVLLYHALWEKDSVQKNEFVLFLNYLVMFLFFVFSIFSFVEYIRFNEEKQKTKRGLSTS